jgi:hypothetical protein
LPLIRQQKKLLLLLLLLKKYLLLKLLLKPLQPLTLLKRHQYPSNID